MRAFAEKILVVAADGRPVGGDLGCAVHRNKGFITKGFGHLPRAHYVLDILPIVRTDYVQRFLFEDLDIRGRLTCLTGAWRRMLDGRDYPQNVATLLGRTTALNVLLGANQKGAGRVTLQVQGSGPIPLLVSDCTAELRIRGMAQYRKEAALETAERRLLGDGRLAVTLEDMKSGRFYQSMVPLEGDSLEQIFA